MMKYVKLTAKPDTWFMEGTEVYSYDCNPPKELKRLTLEEWESYNNFACLVRGFRLCSEKEIELFSVVERWDGEYCDCSEFEMEIVNESY